MIAITKKERDDLQENGLLQFKKVGVVKEDSNFYVANKTHKSRDKSYYVVETPEILKYLGYYEDCNLQKISKNQLDNLLKNNYIAENQVQKEGKYVADAIAFVANDGRIFIEKIAKNMIFLGIWKRKEFKKDI